jgi:hypothetical protein
MSDPSKSEPSVPYVHLRGHKKEITPELAQQLASILIEWSGFEMALTLEG